MNSLLKIFFNPPRGQPDGEKPPEAYAEQALCLRRVWNENSSGLERLWRLFLCSAQFVFPTLLIRNLSHKWEKGGGRVVIEAYVLLKLAFPLAALMAGWYIYPAVIFLTVYFLCETLLNLLSLIFLSDTRLAAVPYRRSLLFILLHYAEVVADFAVIYMGFDLLRPAPDALSALYFSMVVATTVGFGDVSAANAAGKTVVIGQLAVCVVFLTIFINYFTQKTNEK